MEKKEKDVWYKYHFFSVNQCGLNNSFALMVGLKKIQIDLPYLKLIIKYSRSAVALWLAHWPQVLKVPGSIPAGSEENLVSEHASLRVICRDDMNTQLAI